MAVNRKDVRKLLHSLLQGGVTLAEAVLDHQASTLDGKSPVLHVVSTSTNRAPKPNLPRSATIVLGIHVFVLHADSKSNWTEAMAEDLLDDVEYQIAQVVEVNQANEVWQSVQYEMPSFADRISVSGVPYLYEVILVSVEVFH